MSDSAEARAALTEFWALYCSIFARRSLDLPALLATGSKRKIRGLDKYSAKPSIDKLCAHGCHELPLAFLMSIIQPLRSFDEKWKKIAGTPRQRKQMIGTMEKAAVVLEKVLSSIDEVIAENDSSGSTDADHLKDVRRKSISQHFDMPESVSIATLPDLAVTVDALRTYSSVLRLFELSDKDAGIASADTFSKYLFSAYVYRATDHFHDEEVSALIGAALDITYDATAHRMWRVRNYKNIDQKLSAIANMFTDLGEISAM